MPASHCYLAFRMRHHLRQPIGRTLLPVLPSFSQGGPNLWLLWCHPPAGTWHTADSPPPNLSGAGSNGLEPLSVSPRPLQPSCCRVDVGARSLVSLHDLDALLSDPAPSLGADLQLFAFDHVYAPSRPDPRSVAPVVMVLYGAIGTDCFQAVHERLVNASEGSGEALGTMAWGLPSALKPINIHLVLFGMQNRTLGPCLATTNRILVSVMSCMYPGAMLWAATLFHCIHDAFGLSMT
jgi:Thioredoxin-like domain